MVGGVDGDADAPAAGELLAACAKAEAAARDNAAVSSKEDRFMGLLFFLCLSFLTEQATPHASAGSRASRRHPQWVLVNDTQVKCLQRNPAGNAH
jgi:hypothetical protein